MRTDQVFLLTCLGFIGGVFLGSFFVAPWWFFIFLLSLWLAVVVAFPHKKTAVLFIPFTFFVFGIVSVTNSLDRFREENLHPREVTGIFRVVSDPEDKSFYKQVIGKLESCENEDCPQEKILWQASKILNVRVGSKIEFSCTLSLPKNFDPEFDYRMFLAKDSVAYMCVKSTQAEILPEDRRGYFARLFFLPKRAFETAVNKSLPQPEAGLAVGLLIGGDNRLPETLKQGFVTAGLSHIVAISGYNIALIAQGFVLFGIGIGLWRRQALGFAALGILLFIILVGAPASAVRAGVMGICAFGGLFFGRLSRGMNMFLLAGAVMLFFQPLLLRYDIGFQLSFLATLALIVATPYIQQGISKEFFGKSFIEIALMTFAVELFVVPLIIYQFHIFSSFALLTNILLLPLVPYAMAMISLTALGFFILPGLHILPAGVAYGILRVITYTVEYVQTIPNTVVNMTLSPWMFFLWYLSLLLVALGMKKNFIKTYVQAKNNS